MTRAPPTQFPYPPPFWSTVLPRLLEALLLRTVRVETAGSECNIPRAEPLVCAFAPHAGWIDSIVVDACFDRADRSWPVWLTKAENRTLPRPIAGRRLICIDRQDPEPSAVRAIHSLLAQPGAALATAIEGSRFGNPRDPADLRTLGAFLLGPLRFALRAHVPVLPVVLLGGERVLPHLDRVWAREGARGAFRHVRRALARPQQIAIRVLPPYRDHLDAPRVRGRRLGACAAEHTRLLRARFVSQIRALEPAYPIEPVDG